MNFQLVGSFRVELSADNVHLAGRSTFGEATRTKDEVFHRLVFSKREGFRLTYFTTDANGLLFEFVLIIRDIELVFVLKFDILNGAIDDTFEVNGDSQLSAVELHAIEHTTAEECGLNRTISHSNKLANRVQVFAQTILSGTENGTFDAYCIFQTMENGFHVNRVTVHHRKFVKLVVFNGQNRTTAIVSGHANGTGICFSREAACIINELRKRLTFLEFIRHRTTNVSRDIHMLLKRINDNHIAIFQANVIFLTVHQIGVKVNRSHLLAVAEHLDITKRTRWGDTASRI